MKKCIILASAILMCGLALQTQSAKAQATQSVQRAQKYMVVDSEKIFKSIDSYNNALKALEILAQEYQKQIDDAYARVETMYNSYMTDKPRLSATSRQQREDAIINREKEIAAQQESFFGQEGSLIKRRVELIKPIQDKVFAVIKGYAAENGYDIVLDIAANPMVLYSSDSIDKTNEIIAMVKSGI